MSKLLYLLSLSLLLTRINEISNAEVEGAQTCQLLSNNSGVCISIYECPSILNNWKQNISQPIYCSERDAVVCCPNQVEGQQNMRISEKSE